MSEFNRRQFLQTGLAGSLALAVLKPSSTFAAVTKTPGDPFDGLKVGVASYSLRKFPLDKAIAITKDLGVKYITLKDFHLSLKSSPDEQKAASKKIADAGLILMGCGVIYMRNRLGAGFFWRRTRRLLRRPARFSPFLSFNEIGPTAPLFLLLSRQTRLR